MKEIFKISLHSAIDVITNSSTELFIVDKKFGLDFVTKLVKEKEAEFPAVHDHYKVSIFLDNPEWGWNFFDVEEAIKILEAKGYKIVAPDVEVVPQAIMISCEQGYISDKLRQYIIETFNAEYSQQ